MLSKSLAVGALVAACVAAAGGAYVAVRQNATDAAPSEAAAAAATAPASPASPAADTARPVSETEAVVANPPAAAPVRPAIDLPAVEAPARKTAAAPARRSERPDRSENGARTPRPNTTTSEPRRTARAGSSPAAVSAPHAQEAPREQPPAPSRDVREPALEAVPGPPPVAADPTPPPPQVEQIVVPASSVVGLRVDTPLTTERSRLEDRVGARVTRDVIADGRVAIPAGTQAIGSVTLVERGGKMKERARLGVRFHTLVLADGTELPITTEAIFREGDSPAAESGRKIGGAAVGGAILGALIGGKKGAIVGGATGAAGGTAAVMAGDRNAATLPSGTIVTIRLAAPVAVEVEKR